MKSSILFALLIIASWVSVSGQEVKSYGFFVINNKFANYEDLPGISGTIQKVEKALVGNYNYEIEKQVNGSSRDFLEQLRVYSKMEFGRTDQLLIYVSGRVHYDSLFNIRYLLFSNSSEEEFSSMLSFEELLVMLANIQCRHILLALDCGPIWPFNKSVLETAYLGVTTVDGYAHDDVGNRLIYSTRKFISLESQNLEDRLNLHTSFLEFLEQDIRQEEVAGLKDLIWHFQGLSVAQRVKVGASLGDEPAGEFLFQWQK